MEDNAGDRPASERQISFEFIKSNLFRGIHVDGVWGGVTPQGNLAFAFYSERQPIPNRLTYVLKEDNTIGPEIESARITRDAVIRDTEMCVYLAPEVAIAFRDLLDKQLKTLENIRQKKAEDREEN